MSTPLAFGALAPILATTPAPARTTSTAPFPGLVMPAAADTGMKMADTATVKLATVTGKPADGLSTRLVGAALRSGQNLNVGEFGAPAIESGNTVTAVVGVGALRARGSVPADPPPETLVTALAATGVDMTARPWIGPPPRGDAVDALDSVSSNVGATLAARGIDPPHPTSPVPFHDQAEGAGGDATRQREGSPAGDDPQRARCRDLREEERG